MKKVESLKEYIINQVMNEIEEMITSLREDYQIFISISKCELRIILNEFYRYYEKKGIQGYFLETIKGHFEDLSIMAIENNNFIDSDFILNQLRLLELLDSPMEVDPRETKKLILSISKQLERRPRLL